MARPYSALYDQWDQLDPFRWFAREPEADMLFQMLSTPGSVVELVAPMGSGKTTLMKAVAERYQETFGGTTEYFVGSDGFPLLEATDAIAERFRGSSGQNLLVVDQTEMLDQSATMEAINRLGTGPWLFSTILGTREPTGIGQRVTLYPLPRQAFADLIARRLGSDIDHDVINSIWDATAGRHALTNILVERIEKGLVQSPTAISNVFAPIEKPGLVGLDGRPLKAGGEPEKRIISDVRFVSDEVLRHVANNPSSLHEMSSRRFEELVAELLDRRGYSVTLTQATRDGGKDMYAAKRDDLGAFLYVVECKRYSPDRPVGVEVVRQVHGVAQAERVNAAIVMTTSSFSEPARDFARSLRSLISLKDFLDLKDWLRASVGP